MLLSAVSVLVVAQSSSEIPEELMNIPVYFWTSVPICDTASCIFIGCRCHWTYRHTDRAAETPTGPPHAVYFITPAVLCSVNCPRGSVHCVICVFRWHAAILCVEPVQVYQHNHIRLIATSRVEQILGMRARRADEAARVTKFGGFGSQC